MNETKIDPTSLAAALPPPAVDPARGPWFQTASGRVFYPFDPREEEIFFGDIARALAMQCRFNGHCEAFYSVAEHSLWVSLKVAPLEELDVLAKATGPIGRAAYANLVGLGLYGLMHDAAEAYGGDMVSPIKSHPKMSEFRQIEQKIQHTIAERFGFWEWECGNRYSEAHPVVKEADRRMLLTEKRDLRAPSRAGAPQWDDERGVGGTKGLAPYEDLKLRGESPATAERLFRERFEELWTRKTGKTWDDEVSS